MKPMRCRLLEALEGSPMTTRSLAAHLDTTIATVRARLNDFHGVGAVSVVATKTAGIHALNVWGIAPTAHTGE